MTEEIEYVLMDDGQIYAKRINMDTDKTVHEEEKPYKCSICSAAFTCEKNLRIHAQLSHNIGNLQLETFSSNPERTSGGFNLGQEISPIRAYDGKNIEKKDSKIEEIYSTSIKENTSKNVFQCELCNRNYKNEQDLYVHK